MRASSPLSPLVLLLLLQLGYSLPLRNGPEGEISTAAIHGNILTITTKRTTTTTTTQKMHEPVLPREAHLPAHQRLSDAEATRLITMIRAREDPAHFEDKVEKAAKPKPTATTPDIFPDVALGAQVPLSSIYLLSLGQEGAKDDKADGKEKDDDLSPLPAKPSSALPELRSSAVLRYLESQRGGVSEDRKDTRNDDERDLGLEPLSRSHFALERDTAQDDVEAEESSPRDRLEEALQEMADLLVSSLELRAPEAL